MKAFIIHTNHANSLDYANQALASFSGFKGWEPQLFLGLTVETLPEFEQQFDIKTKKNSRAECFLAKSLEQYQTKKCCSLNHYRLAKCCVEIGEPIAVVEHDSHCIGDWVNPDFGDILILNIHSALSQHTLKPITKKNPIPEIQNGVHDINVPRLCYRHDPCINGASIMPGTAAYAIKPHGAKKND